MLGGGRLRCAVGRLSGLILRSSMLSQHDLYGVVGPRPGTPAAPGWTGARYAMAAGSRLELRHCRGDCPYILLNSRLNCEELR